MTVKKSRFMKEQEVKGLFTNLGLKTPLNKIPLLGDILFQYKMNKIINKFLLVGDNFMPEMQLKQPGFTKSACGPLTKNSLQTENTDYIYKNDLDKACFQHDMAYRKYKDLNKRTQLDKVFKNKAFEIASNLKYDRYQRGLASMVFKFFDKKSGGSGIMSNQQLANELHKPTIRKFKRRRVYSLFKGNIWGADLADM